MAGVLAICSFIICLAMIAVWLAMMTAQPRLTRHHVKDSSDSGLHHGADRGHYGSSGDGRGDGGRGSGD